MSAASGGSCEPGGLAPLAMASAIRSATRAQSGMAAAIAMDGMTTIKHTNLCGFRAVT
jgi:hypothetical protein